MLPTIVNTCIVTHVAAAERESPERRVLGVPTASDEVVERREGPQKCAPSVGAHECVPRQPVAGLRAARIVRRRLCVSRLTLQLSMFDAAGIHGAWNKPCICVTVMLALLGLHCEILRS